MNIKKAKEQIKNAMTAYFTRDEAGGYAIPIERQRPVFLMGPPGIGKTAIMEQIASEMGVGLLSYSMTHHTRQSALGLPFIVHKKYGGEEFDVSEYTMSEIIASVYELMESTGIKEGILFLDEINCVSETLAPVMLQFLQYKIFGRHRVPDGWIVVTAGNPPEYNSSVREFDIATWDRLKRIDVEPDLDVWKEYAYKTGIHPAVITYLEIRRDDFYSVENTASGKTFVTARGWEDLSRMISVYEKNGITADEDLTCQYIRDSRISRSFAVYYDLFNKYKSDYRIHEILNGDISPEITARAKAADLDERIAVIGLILDVLTADAESTDLGEQFLRELLGVLNGFKEKLTFWTDIPPSQIMDEITAEQRIKLRRGKISGGYSDTDRKQQTRLIRTLEDMEQCASPADRKTAFANVKEKYSGMVAEHKKLIADTGKKLSNAFRFMDAAFPGGRETLIFVTELTANAHTAKYIARFGCREYYEHNKELLFYERQKEILKELEDLGEL